MKPQKNPKRLVRRNLSWDESVEKTAEELAAHYRLKGGVSELARLLVIDCARCPDKYRDALGSKRRSFRDMLKDLIVELQNEDKGAK